MIEIRTRHVKHWRGKRFVIARFAYGFSIQSQPVFWFSRCCDPDNWDGFA